MLSAYKTILTVLLTICLKMNQKRTIGDNARAMIAIGDTQAIGSVYQRTDVTVSKLTGQEIAYIKNLIDANVPSYLSWAKEIIKLFL